MLVKPINLRPHEARRLAEAGSVLVVRPMQTQPTLWHDPDARDSQGQWSHPVGGLDASRWPCPVAVGQQVWGREKHWREGHLSGWVGEDPIEPVWITHRPIEGLEDKLVRYDDPGDPRHWRPMPPQSMPKWASRFPRLAIASRRFCRLGGVTEEEAKGAGYDDIFEPGDRPFRDSGGNWAYCPEHGYCFDLIDCWNRDNPRHPADGDPWVWVGTVERKGADR